MEHSKSSKNKKMTEFSENKIKIIHQTNYKSINLCIPKRQFNLIPNINDMIILTNDKICIIQKLWYDIEYDRVVLQVIDQNDTQYIVWLRHMKKKNNKDSVIWF